MRGAATIICRPSRAAQTLRRVMTHPALAAAHAAPFERTVRLTVNRQTVEHTVPAHTTLAQLLREHLGLVGTKVACDQAACGACTVWMDGQAVFACHTLAAHAHGANVLTIEGLATDDGEPDALQRAFVAHDALQCGYCTPGMVMAVHATLQPARSTGVMPDRASLAQAISGNVCRCGAYQQIIDAALHVAAAR
jgi:xanthine dehydrogenase YagT iron-sulfur-binding subunit